MATLNVDTSKILIGGSTSLSSVSQIIQHESLNLTLHTYSNGGFYHELKLEFVAVEESQKAYLNSVILPNLRANNALRVQLPSNISKYTGSGGVITLDAGTGAGANVLKITTPAGLKSDTFIVGEMITLQGQTGIHTITAYNATAGTLQISPPINTDAVVGLTVATKDIMFEGRPYLSKGKFKTISDPIGALMKLMIVLRETRGSIA